jgi:hypothetical protein
VKRIALPLFLVGLLAAPVAMLAVAKDQPTTPEIATGMKSVAVVSITSYDELLKDLSFFGDVIGNPGLDQQLDGMLKLFTQGQGLKGLDTSKPWGVAVLTDDMQFVPIAMLPVKSLDDLLGVLGPMVGNPQKENGVYKLQAGPQELFAAEKNGWAFIGQSAQALAKTPADPGKLLALSSRYDLAIKVNVQNVPEMYRTMAIDQLKAGVEQNLAQQPDEDDADYAARKKLMEAQMQQMVTSINETKDLTLGWKIDREQKQAFSDLRMSAVPGTKTAAQMAQLQELPSDFSGFIDAPASVALNFVSKVDREAVEGQLTQLEALKQNAMKQIDKDDSLGSDATKAEAKSIVGELFDAVVATMKAGKLDFGSSVVLGDNELSVIAGGLVADPGKVESSVKKLIALGQKDPRFPAVKFDAVKHKGIRFHTASVPVENNDDLKKVVGDTIDVAIGFGSKHVYLAVGNNNISKVTEAIDKSVAGLGKKYPPMRLMLSLGSILKFAAAVTPDNPTLGALAEELSKSSGKDSVIVQIQPAGADGSVVYRVTAQEGVLKLLGQAGQMAGGAGAAGPPPRFGN